MDPSNVSVDKGYEELDDFDEPPIDGLRSRKLTEGISIKDLCDGKEIMFELEKGAEEYSDQQDENFDEILHFNPKNLRERRGAPPLNCSFETLASNMINVTEDGLVKKQIVTSGIGNIVPDHSYVTVHYNMYKRNCELPFDSTYLRGRPEKFRLDQGEAILGLEYAIKSMKKNENSCFLIKWEVAFGALGCPDRIEEKCDIYADVTLVNFVKINNIQDSNALTEEELDTLDFNMALTEAKKLLCNGSEEFKKGEVKNAILFYKKALRILNNLRLANEEEEGLMLKQKVKCLLNLAICYNKCGKSELACVMCQDALAVDQNNAKAYFHYGRACLTLSNFDGAHKFLMRANKLKPDDKDINKELKKLNDKKALYEMKDKMFWKKAFDGGNTEITSTEESCLETFEQDLRESLKESLKQKKPFVMPGPLLEDEKKICLKVADNLNLHFESKEHMSTFTQKENES